MTNRSARQGRSQRHVNVEARDVVRRGQRRDLVEARDMCAWRPETCTRRGQRRLLVKARDASRGGHFSSKPNTSSRRGQRRISVEARDVFSSKPEKSFRGSQTRSRGGHGCVLGRPGTFSFCEGRVAKDINHMEAQTSIL